MGMFVVLHHVFVNTDAGRCEIVEILMEAGMDPNCFDGSSGSCPLHEAVRFFRKEVIRVLLEFGADPWQKSANDEVGFMSLLVSVEC